MVTLMRSFLFFIFFSKEILVNQESRKHTGAGETLQDFNESRIEEKTLTWKEITCVNLLIAWLEFTYTRTIKVR